MPAPQKTGKAVVLALTGTVMAILAAGTASYAGSTDTATLSVHPSGAYCEVLATPAGNGVVLQAVFHADAGASGSYQLSVKSTGGGNRTAINQGGGFTAYGAGTVPLGTVTVGGNTVYDIGLTVSIAGKVHECGGAYSA